MRDVQVLPLVSWGHHGGGGGRKQPGVPEFGFGDRGRPPVYLLPACADALRQRPIYTRPGPTPRGVPGPLTDSVSAGWV